jgi:branched-chain amino acid transport system ATP-binding protein
MLEGKGIVRKFGGLSAVDGMDFTVERGKIVGLIGPNGSGKTTLFNTITGFYRANAGKILFNGVDITSYPAHEIARIGIARTFQIVRPLLGLTVLENIAVAVSYGRENERRLPNAKTKAEEMLGFVGLLDKKDLPAESLATAERKRLEIARALAIRPELILLDEVFSGLNAAEVEEAIKMIFQLRDQLGITIFLIEHLMKAVMNTCEKVIVMNHGVKLAEGSPQEVANNPAVIEAYLGRKTC